MKSIVSALALQFLIFFSSSAQSDNVGSGRAIQFDGVNDHINLGNIYDNITYPITVSAWVYLENPQGYLNPIFISQDNQDIYNGFWFTVSTTVVDMEIGDGNGHDSPVYRRGKTANVNIAVQRWYHICGVMRSPTDIDLYVNGINVGGNYSGLSNFPMNSNFPSDQAKIGSYYTNGVYYLFKGAIDEVRVYNSSLTQTQVRETMCKKLTGSEAGLIGYWDFNETTGTSVVDKSSKGFNGTLVNGSTRIFSGAPIGDASVYSYPTNWSGSLLTMTEGSETVTVSNVTLGQHGIHTYVVRNAPSQSGGLDLVTSTPPYFGVFAAGIDAGQKFDISYSAGQCADGRNDNSASLWSAKQLIGVTNRMEFIRSSSPLPITINLGADQTLCPFINRVLQPVANPAGHTFLWQDGSTQSTFTPTTYGTYWVIVKQGCSTDRDSITFLKSKEAVLSFDLGANKTICPMEPTLLTPLPNPAGYTFQWQDGSQNSSLLAKTYGKYWVAIKGECDAGSDTIRFIKNISLMNVDLGEDQEICPMSSTTLKPLADPAGYKFQWQDGSTNSSLTVTKYGKYWVSVTGDCSTGSDTILFSKKVEVPEMFIPNIITPNEDGFNQLFIISQKDSGTPVSDLFLEVFNRWGKQVYSTTNYKNNWAGQGLPASTYYYIIRGECIPDKKGWLTISK